MAGSFRRETVTSCLAAMQIESLAGLVIGLWAPDTSTEGQGRVKTTYCQWKILKSIGAGMKSGRIAELLKLNWRIAPFLRCRHEESTLDSPPKPWLIVLNNLFTPPLVENDLVALCRLNFRRREICPLSSVGIKFSHNSLSSSISFFLLPHH